uniref:transmembrane emp24 domain-containing protein 9-like isoform X3 n=1 Tax=Nyctereutes procyonoides TaxID=34880 RepID=UPI0024448134|nr:transmembrane emp24 domain-containing protein 9-like isoform X3 [Nyctereutes procyonoides]
MRSERGKDVFAVRGGALYFHTGEAGKKCFIEEIPDETVVIGNYRTQLYDKQREEYQPATPGLGMFVEVKDPEDKTYNKHGPVPAPTPHCEYHS